MSEIVSSNIDVVEIGFSSDCLKNTELKWSLNMSAACFGVLETKREESLVSVAMETCCGMRLDLVDILKNDQKRLGFEGRVSVKEANNFSRLSFINFWDIRRRFLYFSSSVVEFVRWILRRSVSFFLIRDNISPGNHGGMDYIFP